MQEVRSACPLRGASKAPEACCVQQGMSPHGLSRDRSGASPTLGPPAWLRRLRRVLHTDAEGRVLLLINLSAKVLSPIAFGARGKRSGLTPLLVRPDARSQRALGKRPTPGVAVINCTTLDRFVDGGFRRRTLDNTEILAFKQNCFARCAISRSWASGRKRSSQRASIPSQILAPSGTPI
jgi:hypothetical protein